MSVSGVSSTDQTYQAYLSTYQQDLQNLGSSLQSGNITTAQQGFAQLLQDLQNPAQGINGVQATAQATTAPGSSAPAQGLHHHHHHHMAAGANQDSSTQSAQNGTASSSTASSSSNLAQALLAQAQSVSGILPADTALTGNYSGSLF